jgi:hypothetical protein
MLSQLQCQMQHQSLPFVLTKTEARVLQFLCFMVHRGGTEAGGAMLFFYFLDDPSVPDLFD